MSRHLQIGAVVLGDEGAVALAQHRDLLLDVLDLVLRLLQVDDLDGHHLLGAIVDAFEHLSKRALANALQLGEQLLWICFGILGGEKKKEQFLLGCSDITLLLQPQSTVGTRRHH